MFKNSVFLSISLCILTACGGSSDNSSSEENKSTEPLPSTSPSHVTVKVIDGYLSDADVCVIKENTSECTFIGSTNEQGNIDISKDLKGQLVATITAGKTKDSDSAGFVPRSYQLTANISSDTPTVISPYTTLDVLNNDLNMADIASDLNLPLALLEGDYVASNSIEKSQVHALARAITTQLSANFDNNDTQALYATVTSANQYISTDLINAGVSLDNINVIIKKNSYSYSQKIETLSSFLESQPLEMVSMNTAFFAHEGILGVTFKDNVVTLSNGATSSYTFSDDELVMVNNGKESKDLFLYVSASLSLSVPSSDTDLVIITTNDLGNGHAISTKSQASWIDSGLIGQTKYLLFDDASVNDHEPDPTLIKLEFAQSTVTLTENGETVTVPWTMDTQTGLLTLKLRDIYSRDIRYMEVTSDENISILRELSFSAPTLMLSNEELATSLYQRWLNLI